MTIDNFIPIMRGKNKIIHKAHVQLVKSVNITRYNLHQPPSQVCVFEAGTMQCSTHKLAALVCGARAQNQATTHRQNCHNIAMFIFDKWKSKIKQNGYYSSFHFFYWIVCIFPHKSDF